MVGSLMVLIELGEPHHQVQDEPHFYKQHHPTQSIKRRCRNLLCQVR